MIIVDAFINAAAIWFVLKIIEVLPTAIYDIIAAIERWKTARDAVDDQDDGAYYDTRRGKLDYIFSGTHFGDLRLFGRSKKWLLISTLIPVIVFVLELMSIFLGYETRNCEASRDRDLITAPSLELFGKGVRQTNIDIQHEDFVNAPFGRACVTWPSSNSGVNYYSSICADSFIVNTFHSFVKFVLPTNLWTGLMIAKRPLDLWSHHIFVVVSLPRSGPSEKVIVLGNIALNSRVVVNGKNVLIRNATAANFVVNEKVKQEFREDVRRFEDLRNATHSEYYEDDLKFGFHWDTVNNFVSGSPAVIHAVLAQATRSSVKTATQMSNANMFTSTRVEFDISCQHDYVLPRKASIIIIVTAIVMRLLLIALPTSLSPVEFAFDSAQKIANSEDWSVFFMDRKRVICRRERFKE